MPNKVTGFDKHRRNLDQLARNAKALDGRHEVRFGELFDSESFEASPFTVEGKEDFAAIPDEPWDAFIREATRFGDAEGCCCSICPAPDDGGVR